MRERELERDYWILNTTTYYEIDKVVKIAQYLKERRNLVNRYQHSIDGFECKVFNCRVTVGGFGMECKVSNRNWALRDTEWHRELSLKRYRVT